MAALGVDEVYRFVQFVANKESRGWISPEEFNIAAELAQIAAYSKRERVFIDSKVVHADLRPFLKLSGVLAGTGGLPPTYFAYPADLRHFLYAYETDGGGTRLGNDIHEWTQTEYAKNYNSTIIAPTTSYMRCVQRGDGLYIYPMPTNVRMEYLSGPTTAPEWAYTTVSGRPVYASGSSTPFTFDEVLFEEIAAHILASAGMNIGKEEVTQYGIAFNQQK